jgi:hypothetical protein
VNHSGFGLQKNGENEEGLGLGINLAVLAIANDGEMAEDNGVNWWRSCDDHDEEIF